MRAARRTGYIGYTSRKIIERDLGRFSPVQHDAVHLNAGELMRGNAT